MKVTRTQRLLLDRMSAGKRLWWFGDNGPELDGHPFWPQRRTVRAMIRAGVLRWKPWGNPTQQSAGICELEVIFRRPTDEEAAVGFAELYRLPIACWVTASDFAPPSYCCGGHEESVAESYVRDHLEKQEQDDIHPRAARVFDAEVRHEKLEDWVAIRVTVKVRGEFSTELLSEIPGTRP